MPEKVVDQRFLAIAERHDEPVAAFLGMEVVELKAGYARISVTIKREHVNFHGVAFGGIIMSLADQAFGYAVNSLAYPSVASQFNTYFLSSARCGDELVAEGRVVRSGRRVSVAEVSVTDGKGTLIAQASGMTIRLDAD
jgi:acyl-CoA thioesterase